VSVFGRLPGWECSERQGNPLQPPEHQINTTVASLSAYALLFAGCFCTTPCRPVTGAAA
jgi:hypothetical protein